MGGKLKNKKNYTSLRPSTKCIHAGGPEDPWRALTPPLYQTSTFTFQDFDQVDRVLKGEEDGFVYGRMGNPTTDRFEKLVSELEEGEKTRSFASGMGAISAILIHLAKKHPEIAFPKVLYGGTRAFIEQYLIPSGCLIHWFDPREEGWDEELSRRLSPDTGAIFAETPSNPVMTVIDLEKLSSVAKKAGAPLVVDNTFATPILQKPLVLGADIVVHSATKYLGGHGDLLGGTVTGKASLIDRLSFEEGSYLGATLSPFNAWLLLRGMKTLPLRMDAHCRGAMMVAEFLSGHPGVKSVHYPGLSKDPGHKIASSQMKGFGGMLSFSLGDDQRARRVASGLELFKIAVSLGDPESLIEHPASLSHRQMTAEERMALGIDPGFLRVSVGLEDPEDLVLDLKRALER
jgi:methionine-gamma-lyase